MGQKIWLVLRKVANLAGSWEPGFVLVGLSGHCWAWTVARLEHLLAESLAQSSDWKWVARRENPSAIDLVLTWEQLLAESLAHLLAID